MKRPACSVCSPPCHATTPSPYFSPEKSILSPDAIMHFLVLTAKPVYMGILSILVKLEMNSL